jgi:hypothetical protein
LRSARIGSDSCHVIYKSRCVVSFSEARAAISGTEETR